MCYFQDELFTATVIYLAMDFDSTGTTHPLTNYAAKSTDEIRAMFSIISYEKVHTAKIDIYFIF